MGIVAPHKEIGIGRHDSCPHGRTLSFSFVFVCEVVVSNPVVYSERDHHALSDNILHILYLKLYGALLCDSQGSLVE